jgi:uncharacterized protein YjiS (DUF1127 family)
MLPESLTAERIAFPTSSQFTERNASCDLADQRAIDANLTVRRPQARSTSSHAVRFVPVESLRSTLSIWRARIRQRQALSMLSDYLLSDIGLTRADVDKEVRRRFWQA